MYSITEQFIAWLSAKGYAAHTYPPKDAPAEFVTVERTGGNMADLVDHPTVAVQTWAKTEARAEEMALAIRDLLTAGDMPYGCASARVNSGPYPFWDEDTGAARHQTVYDCTTIAQVPAEQPDES